MRWDDDEKRMRFKGKIVCPTALFEDVVAAILFALWALNDLPGAVSRYSPHRLFLGRDPVGWGDCLPVSLQDGAEDAGQFFGRMLDEHAEV